MSDALEVEAVVEEFLTRQREMYAGGDLDAVEEFLADDVVWHVPGTSPIAGDYRGREAVTAYFRLRRELAGGAIRVAKGGEAHHEEAPCCQGNAGLQNQKSGVRVLPAPLALAS